MAETHTHTHTDRERERQTDRHREDTYNAGSVAYVAWRKLTRFHWTAAASWHTTQLRNQLRIQQNSIHMHCGVVCYGASIKDVRKNTVKIDPPPLTSLSAFVRIGPYLPLPSCRRLQTWLNSQWRVTHGHPVIIRCKHPVITRCREWLLLALAGHSVYLKEKTHRIEGNRRSGVALAMCHRQQWYFHLQAHGLGKGDEHPAYTPAGVELLCLYIKQKPFFTTQVAVLGIKVR